MKYFKVVKNYNGDFVSIDETELELAIYCFQTDVKAVFRRGLVRGQDILDIKPDFNKALGYNVDYKIQPEDYCEVDIIRKGFEKLYYKINNRVKYLIQNNKTNLIGKNIGIPELENKESKVLSEGSQELADKFNVNK